MHKIINWLLTPLYVPLFYAILVVFHPLQLVSLLFGYRAHKFVLDLMNFFLILNFRTVGTRIDVEIPESLPRSGPIIFVSNHQSMYDIPLLIWFLRAHHPKFIAKKELGRGIPSISLALRVMGSVLIDRKDQAQAINAIKEFGEQTVLRGHSACIFPEGTRARNGELKAFKPAGLVTLLRAMPNAALVPVVIEGTWEMVRFNLFPVVSGVRMKLKVLAPLDRNGVDERDLAVQLENRIREALAQLRLGR